MPDTGSLPALEGMRSRHYRVDAPGLAGYPLQPGESMCGSDHHKWPCHAHILGGAVAAVLGLADSAEEVRDHSGYETSGRLVGWRGCGPHDIREAITRELLGEEPPA